MIEQIQKSIAIAWNNIWDVLWEKFVDLSYHGNTLMALHPIVTLDELIYLQ